jgi:hypothetical protein
MAATAPKLEPPLEPPRRIPVMSGKPILFRWFQQLIWLFLAANVGTLVISALYYLIIEVDWHIGHNVFLHLKPDWDHLFGFRGWAADRHDIRNVYEALLSTLFVRSLLANWRKRDRRAPAWYVAISPVLIVVVAFPIVIAGIALINHGLPGAWHALFAHHRLHNPLHMPRPLAWFGTYLSGYAWQPTLIGIVAGLVVHRVYAPAGNTVQMYFIGRAVDRTRDAIEAGEDRPYRHLPRWPWPPLIRERAAWIMHNDLSVPNRTYSIAIAVRIFMVVFGALAVYGIYVRYWIAKGHAF